MNFLPLAPYQIYLLHQEGWIFLRRPDEPPNYSWNYGLSAKKICLEFFKITGGVQGYYTVHLKQKKFYYCGIDLEAVRRKLESLNGLCRNLYYSSVGMTAPSLIEEKINPLEETDHTIFLRLERSQLRPYDAQSLLQQQPVDVGINLRELKQRILTVAEGQDGIYAYRSKNDDVIYIGR